VPATSAVTPMEPTAVAFARSGSSSAWEAAVRQGSALAVAPGRGFVPGSGLGSSNRTPSPGPEAAASLPARSHSTAADPSAAGLDRGPSPSRFSHRSVSCGGMGPSSQLPFGRSSEQGSARPHTPPGLIQQSAKPQQMVLSSLAEANELSLAHSHVLGQVESLLSPLASYEASGEALGAADVTGKPPAGTAATGDAVSAAAAAAAGVGVGIEPRLVSNPLYSESLSQPGQGPTLQQQQGWAGAAPGSVVAAAPAVTSARAVSLEATTAAAAAEAAAAVGAGALTSTGQPVPLDLLEEALHWHAYANAIYGWPMFLWSHRYRCAAVTFVMQDKIDCPFYDRYRVTVGMVGRCTAAQRRHEWFVSKPTQSSRSSAPSVLMLAAGCCYCTGFCAAAGCAVAAAARVCRTPRAAAAAVWGVCPMQPLR
jgi:hypothetical protein